MGKKQQDIQSEKTVFLLPQIVELVACKLRKKEVLFVSGFTKTL
jgi:hypothetical protein